MQENQTEMALIEEKDLDANELISALKNIETESADVLELQYLREENRRLRNDLMGRHQTRLKELQQIENQKRELLHAQKQIFKEGQQLSNLQTSVVKVNQNLDEAMDLLFQVSYGFLQYSNIQDTFEKLQKVHKLIHDGSKQLSFSASSSVEVADNQQFSTKYPSSISASLQTNQQNAVPQQYQEGTHFQPSEQDAMNELNTFLDEIRNFDFETVANV